MEFTRCLRCMQPLEGYPCPSCGFDPAKDASLDYGLRPGSILNGKYVIGTALGQGGFGITYAGWDLALDCKVAIKEYYPAGQVVRDGSTSSQLRWFNTAQSEAAQNAGKEMFLKEARKMTRVRNISRVVHVHDLFQENETAYIVMDFVEGQTLKAYLSQHGMLSWEEAKEIFFPAIRAMEQVHQAGLVHRDLSPDNLMLTQDGDVQILDLGAAKDLNINSGASSMQVAKTGFSPMEQYSQRGGSGPWTDVYAMAATMYYSITGVLPPPVMDRVEEDQLRWDLEPLQAIPASAREALKKALTVFPKSRTQSMAEFLRGLMGEIPRPAPEAKSVPIPEPVPAPAPKTEPIPEAQHPAQKPTQKKSPILAIIAAVLVVALVAGWALWPKNAAEPQMESVAQTTEQTQIATEKSAPTEPEGISLSPDEIPDEMTSADGKYQVAFVTDVGTLKDKSFNQGTYDGVKLYAAANNKSYKYYQPANGNNATDDDRIDAFNLACENGAEVVVAAGFMQEYAMSTVATKYPDVHFVFIDGYPVYNDNGEILVNVAGIAFDEHESGYLAGYAAVMEGYTSLGFCGGGGGTNPACVRFGYGFVQGADAAAAAKGVHVDMNYSWNYGSSFSASTELQTMTAGWYQNGTEVIFCCGGSMFASVSSAASAEDGYVIGVDVDQSFESPTVITSAIKNLAEATQWAITQHYEGNWEFIGATSTYLGARYNAVGLPTATWSLENWSLDDYNALLAEIADGNVTISSDLFSEPESTDNVTVNIFR